MAWELLGTPAERFLDPGELVNATGWSPAIVPGTVAQSLPAATNLDAQDWWYRGTLATEPGRARLVFEGLATHAQVWVNGSLALEADNMFRVHEVELELAATNAIMICFRALQTSLARKRRRPRWKTNLVAHQNLRFERTTLIGRIPAWCPAMPPIGPYRPIRIETQTPVVDLIPSWDDGVARLRVDVRWPISKLEIRNAHIEVAEQRFALEIQNSGDAHASAHLALPGLTPWWPHTHGESTTHSVRLGYSSNGQCAVDLGRVGFRSIDWNGQNLVINGTPVFARGACWTTSDLASLDGDSVRLRAVLETARRANLNIIRVGGTMAYPPREFYRECDDLGLMVWQDFMFANLDYPVGDETFAQEIRCEAEHQLSRLARHACVAVYCGGSEVQQQAAMMGLPRESWSNVFFDETLPQLRDRRHPGVPYFPSSPCASPHSEHLPFHVGDGIAHYYGVGAYRRPIADVRRAGVRFASECLGFSNIPDAEEMERLADGGKLPSPHSPAWKAGVPRDRGAGYDFEDVRDHYLRELFGLDPVALRAQDVARYFDASRVVTGEVMKRVFAEWRRPDSNCGGAIVWFLQDLAPGAGWGLLDHRGHPKAAIRALARVCAPQAAFMTDEGVDGLAIHVRNDAGHALTATLELTTYQHGRRRDAHASKTVEVAARSGVTVNADAMLGYFADLTNAYGFGPRKYDVIHVALVDAPTGAIISEDFHFPAGLNLPYQSDAIVTASARRLQDGDAMLAIETSAFLQSVQVRAPGFTSDDDSFNLIPGRRREIRLRSHGANVSQALEVDVSALNLLGSIVVRESK